MTADRSSALLSVIRQFGLRNMALKPFSRTCQSYRPVRQLKAPETSHSQRSDSSRAPPPLGSPPYTFPLTMPVPAGSTSQPEYPLIDSDPHFSRVMRYMRPADLAIWTSATVAFPTLMAMWGESPALPSILLPQTGSTP
jgi:hypothetical protein